MGDVSKTKIEDLENKTPTLIQSLQDNIDLLEKENEKKVTELSEQNTKLNKVYVMFEGFESEFESAKDRLRKVVDDMQNTNKSLGVFESRHVETVERMREVTMLVSNVESEVQKQEQRYMKQKEEDFNVLNNQIQEIKKEQGGHVSKFNNINDDNQMLLEKLNLVERNIDTSLKNLKNSDSKIFDIIQNSEKNNGDKFTSIDKDIHNNSDKLKQLQDAYQTQMEKTNYMETLTQKINVIEDNRQQSDARVRDEIDSTLKQDKKLRDEDKKELLLKIDQLTESLQKQVLLFGEKTDNIRENTDSLTEQVTKQDNVIANIDSKTVQNLNSIDNSNRELKIEIENLKASGTFVQNKADDIEKSIKEKKKKMGGFSKKKKKKKKKK